MGLWETSRIIMDERLDFGDASSVHILLLLYPFYFSRLPSVVVATSALGQRKLFRGLIQASARKNEMAITFAFIKIDGVYGARCFYKIERCMSATSLILVQHTGTTKSS